MQAGIQHGTARPTLGWSSDHGKFPYRFSNPFKAPEGFALVGKFPASRRWEAAGLLSWLMVPQRAQTAPSSSIPRIRAQEA